MQIIVQKIITHYKEKGTGAPFILLHGWGANLESFNLIFEELAKKHKVYALDLPGFGKTQLPLKTWGVSDYAEFIEAFLLKLKIEKATFLGHSFGGRILIKLAAKKPELFEKLILTGAAGIKTKDHLKKNLFKVTAKIGKTVLSLPGLKSFQQKAKEKLYQTAGTNDYLSAGELKETFLKVTKEDLTPFLTKIQVETLLIWGESDLDAPVKDGELMHKLIPNSDLKIIQNAGHFAFIDQPVEFRNYLS